MRHLGQSFAGSGFLYEPHEPEQDAGADEGHDDRADQSAAGENSDQAEDPSSDHAADDADDNVHQHAEAAAAHYFSSEKTGDSTDDDPPEQATDHVFLLSCVRVSRRARACLERRLHSFYPSSRETSTVAHASACG